MLLGFVCEWYVGVVFVGVFVGFVVELGLVCGVGD